MNLNSKPDEKDPWWCRSLEPALARWRHEFVRSPQPHFVFWELAKANNDQIWAKACIEDGHLTVVSAPYKYKAQAEQYTFQMSVNDCVQWFVSHLQELDTQTEWC